MKKILNFIKGSADYVSMVNSGAGILPDYATKEQFTSGKAIDSEKDAAESEELWGLFANDMPQNILTRVYNFKLKGIILAGDESPVMIENLRRSLVPDIVPEIEIVKRSLDDITTL